MAANLNFGSVIASSSVQRDNCVNEKYCFKNIATNCTNYGGLYMWDEVMRYDNVLAAQGFCPPGWHIPTENEWNILFSAYLGPGFAGSALKYSGYSGFNAFLKGKRHTSASWDFDNFAVMFWSSSQVSPDKAWAHGLNEINPSVSWYPGLKAHSFAVRCIQD
jgi:uncharacterized protein (TIGR02145 family)